MNASTSTRWARVRLASIAAMLVAFSGSALPAADLNYVDLIPTPPDLTASVDPNIVVTFDDSGSMANHYMGDNRPFDNAAWGAPWGCAATIDNRITSASDLRSKPMNGVYYNPNVLYTPPIYHDGTSFPNADGTLAAVWADGVAVKRPVSPVTPAAAALNGNPNSATNGSDNKVTIINGKKTTGTGGSDKRWTCGYGSYPTAFADGSAVNNGGPYFYRYKGPTIPVTTAGIPTGPAGTAGTGLNLLYNAANWEAVLVPNTTATIDGVAINQWQNFANWYAYYRTRNLMTRTALSRVFSQFGDNIRVAWQNIAPYVGYGAPSVKIDANTIITNLNNTNAAAPNYRKNFYDWIFATQAVSNTPDRAATIGAGEFFRRTNTANLKDPYWEPPKGTDPGRELSCRQNFHMLVTDGYWNEDNPSSLPAGFYGVSTAPTAQPDGTAFTHTTQSRVIWDVPASPTGSCSSDNSTNCYPSLADIAYFYWSKDLRTDLNNTVPPYLPNKTVGVTSSAPLGSSPIQNPEVYYNPANDPASWQHVVQFMVTLGVAGKLQFSDDVNCTDPNNDLCKLRKGQANSGGATGWPQPARNVPAAIDDTWHAAVNSRGSYFSAGDPSALVEHLTDIITSILQRRGASTALAATLPLLSTGTDGYQAGYDTSDWSGYVTKNSLDPDTGGIIGPPAQWDASCLLTGGPCPGAPSSGGHAARDPNTRRIYTSNGVAGTTKTFTWANLNTFQRSRLNVNPATLQLSLIPPTWTVDAFGDKRVAYLRGDRTLEVTGTPQFRQRTSVMGAVIHGQPVYVSSPKRGFRDVWPTGSPEAATDRSYSNFQYANRIRSPVVYVAANDGMLHAFDAVSGVEQWAYVPNILFGNFGLDKLTKFGAGLTATVDDTPLNSEVFINGAWKNVLLGSMRLGGRGIYALDITDPATLGAGAALWEFSNVPPDGSAPTGLGDCAAGSNYCSSLGYTYNSVNTARLHNGKWVALVASGYFPKDSLDPASKDVKGKQASLMVIDLQTGTLIRELKTSANQQGVNVTNTAFGLSTPIVYDFGGDQIDDIAVAGDLAGNLWRFDLSSSIDSDWKVDLMFRTYGNSDLSTAVGDQPITVNPQAMVDTTTRNPIFIFGTGKYLGASDRTSTIPTQAYYGIRDYGTGSSNYPIKVNELVTQRLSEDADGVRKLIVDPAGIPAAKRGWRIKMDVTTGGPAGNGEPGERSIDSAFPFYSSNRVLLKSIIPKSADPCDPGSRYAIMVVDAATGGPPAVGGPASPNDLIVGAAFSSPAPIGNPVVPPGGGGFVLPGLQDLPIPQRVKTVLSPPDDNPCDPSDPTCVHSALGDDVWHRTAWRELLDVL